MQLITQVKKDDDVAHVSVVLHKTAQSANFA
jgi:hypothetical protein